MTLKELVLSFSYGSAVPRKRFSHLWWEKDELRISLKPNIQNAGIQPVAVLLSTEGEILQLTGREHEEILGQTIDWNSLSEDQTYIYDSEFIHQGARLVGQIIEGEVVFFEDRPQAISITERRTLFKKMENIQNLEFSRFFKSLLQNSTSFHSTHWFTGKSFNHELHITEGNFKLYISLSGFYEYRLKISVTHRERNTIFLTLRNAQALRIFNVLEELETHSLSNLSKALMMMTHEIANITSIRETNGVVEALVCYDGRRGRPAGSHYFFFNFTDQTVTCSNTRNRRYIPVLLRELNDKIQRNETYLENHLAR